MSGLSPKLPLMLSEEHGAFSLNKTFKEATKQNLKNLILTTPGEKMMDLNFGVGLRKLLFEHDIRYIQSEIEAVIQQQVKIYMPHIILLNFEILDRRERTTLSPNSISVKIEYRITPLNEQDLLDITIE